MSARRTAVALVASAALLVGCGEDDRPTPSQRRRRRPPATRRPTGRATTPTDQRRPAPDGETGVVGTVASGLAVPWGIDFLPDGRAVVTERDTARVLVITPAGR